MTQADKEQPTAAALPNKENAVLSPIKNFLLILAVCGIAIIGGILYLSNEFEELKVDDKRQQKSISTLEYKLSQLANSLSKIESPSSPQAGLMTESLQHSAQQILNKMQQEESTWRLQDAKELLRLAALQLSILQNIPTSLALVTAADEQIKAIHDPQLQSVRNTLAIDKLALENAERLDIGGALAQINAIREALPHLSWPLDFRQQNAQNHPILNEPDLKKDQSWRDNFWASVAYIKQFLVIRHNTPVEDRVLDAAGQNNVLLILDLALLKADTGLLRRDPDLYQAGIHQAQTMLVRYFNPQDPATQTLVEALAKLKQFSFEEKLPSLDNALLAVEQALQNIQNKKPATPIEPSETPPPSTPTQETPVIQPNSI